MIDFVLIASILIAAVIALAIGFILGGYFNVGKLPGAKTWAEAARKHLPVMLMAWMDGYLEYQVISKEASGDVIFNKGESNETLDRSVFDKKPMQMLEGERILIRASASVSPHALDELAEVQRTVEHVKNNPDTYPLLSKLKDFEIMGVLGHDPQTVRELMGYHSRVQQEYYDEKTGKLEKRTKEEVDKMEAEKVEAYMKEVDLFRKNVKFDWKRDIWLDIGKAVDATMLPFAVNAWKAVRSELEKYFQGAYEPQQNEFWKGALLGGVCCAIGAGLAVYMIKP